MEQTTKQSVLSAFRHALTAIGGIVVAHGWATQNQITELVGALPILVGPLWGMLDEYLAAHKVTEDARLKAAVDAAVQAALAAHAPAAAPAPATVQGVPSASVGSDRSAG